jgi:hypothetical protein
VTGNHRQVLLPTIRSSVRQLHAQCVETKSDTRMNDPSQPHRTASTLQVQRSNAFRSFGGGAPAQHGADRPMVRRHPHQTETPLISHTAKQGRPRRADVTERLCVPAAQSGPGRKAQHGAAPSLHACQRHSLVLAYRPNTGQRP